MPRETVGIVHTSRSITDKQVDVHTCEVGRGEVYATSMYRSSKLCLHQGNQHRIIHSIEYHDLVKARRLLHSTEYHDLVKARRLLHSTEYHDLVKARRFAWLAESF